MERNDPNTKMREKIYKELEAAGVEVLLDDRNERAGFKFKDSDLLGIPSDDSITNQSAEVNQKHSRELETVEELTEQDELLKKDSPAQIREIIPL